MKNLTPLEYAGQRVLLSRQVAEVFGVMYAKVKKTFQSHRAKFVAGVHFYLLEGQELKEFRTEHLNQFKRMRMAQMIYLWTASGVALLSKRFEGGEKIYAELAREYFQVEDAEQVPQIVTIQGVRGYIDAKGVVWLNAEDVARGLGFVMIRNERVTKSCDNGARYSAVRWNTVNEYLRVFAPFIDDSEVRALIEKGVGLGDYIPENLFYLLAMKANNETAKKFQSEIVTKFVEANKKSRPQVEPLTIENVHCYIDAKGVAWLNVEDVARGLGFTQIKNGVEYVMWWRVENYLKEFGFSADVRNGFIPENMFYRLAMKASNAAAQKFQAKVADEILPELRKKGYYSVNNEPTEESKKKRKSRSEYASVYGMKMSNNLVKIGHSDDVEGRIPEVERESGWQVKDEYHTPRMERPRAIKEEFRLHKKYSHVKVHGEYFNADFDDVKGDIDEITLTLEEEIVIGVSDNDKKLLVEMTLGLPDSPFKEQLAKETANLLLGEKIFV